MNLSLKIYMDAFADFLKMLADWLLQQSILNPLVIGLVIEGRTGKQAY